MDKRTYAYLEQDYKCINDNNALDQMHHELRYKNTLTNKVIK